MDKNFINMMKLFSYGATGNENCIIYDFDYEKVMFYANEQGVWQIVHYAVEQLLKQNKISVDKNLFDITKMQVIMSCLKNFEKISYSHKVIEEFNKNGIKNCVIKGESLSALYYKPECRISGDVDIYIGNENEDKACEILSNFGYVIEQKSDDANHYSCMHPVYGELELHTTLYYKIIQETWFKNIAFVSEPFIEYENYNTLGYTDGCINVALHTINHFLSSGFGVRHIMDFLLYLDHFYDKINIEKFISTMKDLKYYHFIEVILGIGEKYFDIKQKIPSCYSDDEIDKVLDTIYKGGIFGHKLSGENTFEIYTSLRIANSGKNPEKVMRKWRRKNVLKALSFAPSRMYKHYPYCRKNKLLLPVAWCNHIGYIFKTAFKRRKIVSDVIKYKTPEKNEGINKKIELLKELDMI